MPRLCIIIFVFFLSLEVFVLKGMAQPVSIIKDDHSDSLMVHLELIYYDNQQFFYDIFYQVSKTEKIDISIQCYAYNSTSDSLLIYSLERKHIELKKEKNIHQVSFKDQKTKSYVLPSFSKVVRNTRIVPTGQYVLYATIKEEENEQVTHHSFRYAIDSMLPTTSLLNKDMEKLTKSPGILSKDVLSFKDKNSKSGNRSKIQLEKYLRSKNLQYSLHNEEGKDWLYIYSDEWFLGKKHVLSGESLISKFKNAQELTHENIGDFTNNALGNYQSLMAQFRELRKESKDNETLSGDVAVSSSFSNDQDPHSEWDNNFYELRGNMEFAILDIPVQLSGYYTTQDRNREAKASYFHFKYDAYKAKEQLMKLIQSYNNRYTQTLAQGGNYQMMYGHYIQNLETEKNKTLANLSRELNVTGEELNGMDSDVFKRKAKEILDSEKNKIADNLKSIGNSDSSISTTKNEVTNTKAKAEEEYNKLTRYYDRLKEIEQKIQQYKSLLDQYQNTFYFDSVLAYSKLNQLNHTDELSYKDMAKKASGILPEGKSKSIISGLTGFDAGIFPKYVSRYTLSGQVIKGADASYDIGFAEVGATYGATEYIDRSGQLEKYKSYGGRIRLKPFIGQGLGFNYYSYSPSKRLLTEYDFFKDKDISLPSFRNQVHILSAAYQAQISRFATVEAEFASSQKPGQSDESKEKISFMDRSAYNILVTGNIPQTDIEMSAEYEYVGFLFENSTLPLTISGTEQIRLHARNSFFRSFLTLAVSYHYMLQTNLHSEGKQEKWGFEMSTHSKRYPTISLSYKPFTTFRTFNDTLTIEQKPLLGDVWTGRLNYQIKRMQKIIRLSLLYNQNQSSTDSLKYSSRNIQMNFMYNQASTMVAVNLGTMHIHAEGMPIEYPAFNNSNFMNLNAGLKAGRQVQVNAGTDLAYNKSGIVKYGGMTSVSYSLIKTPIVIRGNFRYINYKMKEDGAWKPVYSGGIELLWRFKTKLFDF